jgi:hypothetical protein
MKNSSVACQRRDDGANDDHSPHAENKKTKYAERVTAHSAYPGFLIDS